MSMIQQTNRLPLALAISVLVNGAVLIGLSLLMDTPSVKNQPSTQSLTLNTFSAPVDSVMPNLPTNNELQSQDAPETLVPDSDRRSAPELNATSSKSPSMTTATNTDNNTNNKIETVIEVEAADVNDTSKSQSSELPPEPDTHTNADADANTKREYRTSNALTDSTSLSSVPETNETEPMANENVTEQRKNREDLASRSSLETPNTMVPADIEVLPLAQIEHQPELDYPARAKRRRQQGQVVLRAWLNEQGKLEQLSILTSSGHPLLDESALEQIRTWTFQSLAKGSQHRWIKIPVDFQLR